MNDYQKLGWIFLSSTLLLTNHKTADQSKFIASTPFSICRLESCVTFVSGSFDSFTVQFVGLCRVAEFLVGMKGLFVCVEESCICAKSYYYLGHWLVFLYFKKCFDFKKIIIAEVDKSELEISGLNFG